MQTSPAAPSPVYGPVESWRFGRSLGIDLLLHRSICNFRCVYCQLGRIEQPTDTQAEYVATARITEDLKRVNWDKVDVVTFSGSGEPTLALNIGEAALAVRQAAPAKPLVLLTNSTWLHDERTRRRVRAFDIIECKLDSITPKRFRKVSRPVEGVAIDRALRGIWELKHDPDFTGKVHIQVMILPGIETEMEEMAQLLSLLEPEEIHLNLVTRESPQDWRSIHRENHLIPAEGTNKPPTNRGLCEDNARKLAERIKCLSQGRIRIRSRAVW